MFTDPRELKFDSPVQFKRRMRHVQSKLCCCLDPVHPGDGDNCPVHRNDDRCSCNGTEAEACAYCRRKARHDAIPF